MTLFSTVSATGEGQTECIQTEAGLQANWGLSDKIDLRLRYELLWSEHGDYSSVGNIIGFGPKISLIKDNLALSLPLGTTIDDAFMYNLEFHPTMLLTWPAIPEKLEITLSPKYIICKDCPSLGAVNLGLVISNDLSSWSLRPEYGLLYDFGKKGHVGQFSIGVSKTFGKQKLHESN